MADSKTVRVMVSGRVQGVWFRAWTVEQAYLRNLTGWVRNRHDSRVEAVIAGEADAVDDMIRVMHEGPKLAKVDALEVSDAADEDPGEGFTQHPTV